MAEFWEVIDQAWRRSGREALDASGPVLGRIELEERFSQLIPALAIELDAQSLRDARSWLGVFSDCARLMHREDIITAMYGYRRSYAHEGSLIALFGERFFRAVFRQSELAAQLRPVAESLGDEDRAWPTVFDIVRARWKMELIAEIRAAFDDVPYPGDNHVTSSDWATEKEARFFCGKDWRSITFDDLFTRTSELCFLTPLGLRYVLPAYLLASIADARAGGYGHTTALEYLFVHMTSPQAQATRGELIATLSPAQKSAVSNFLAFTFEWIRNEYTYGYQGYETVQHAAVHDAVALLVP